MITPFRSILFLAALAPFLSCSSGPTESAALAQAQLEIDSLKTALAASATDATSAASTALPRSEVASPPPPSSSDGWTSIGDGFSYRGVSFSSTQGISTAIGEIRNESNKTFLVTLFTLNVYDASGALIDAGFVGVENFGSGQVKSFQSIFTKNLNGRASVGMTFDSGHGVTN